MQEKGRVNMLEKIISADPSPVQVTDGNHNTRNNEVFSNSTRKIDASNITGDKSPDELYEHEPPSATINLLKEKLKQQ